MKAFTSTTMTKEELLKELKIHQKADDFIKGSYDTIVNGSFKGCAVGCSLESLNRKKGLKVGYNDHYAYEPNFGIPMWLAKMEDRIFEGLPTEDAKKWPVKFTAAINKGADLNKIFKPLLVIICESTLTTFDHAKYPASAIAINVVIKLLKNKKTTKQQFLDARKEARAYAAYAAADAADDADAADAAAAAYAAYAAYAAADAAAYAADAAADAAYARSTAKFKYYKILSQALIKLIKECK